VHDVRRIVVVGQHTDCCVPHTSYDAFLRGLEVVVPADATAVLEPLSQEPAAARQQRALDYPPTFTGCLWCPPLTCLGRQATAGSPRPDSSRCRAG
jgi:hypothetical protein